LKFDWSESGDKANIMRGQLKPSFGEEKRPDGNSHDMTERKSRQTGVSNKEKIPKTRHLMQCRPNVCRTKRGMLLPKSQRQHQGDAEPYPRDDIKATPSRRPNCILKISDRQQQGYQTESNAEEKQITYQECYSDIYPPPSLGPRENKPAIHGWLTSSFQRRAGTSE
jgi:hypothetical protein